MDEAKRAELYARREEILAGKERQDRIRRRAEFVAMVPILSALEAAGDEYDSFGFNRLTGPLNWWACDADRFPMREKSRVDLPAEPAARDAVILAHLRERFGADDPVTIILRREEIVLTMRMPVLIRHLDTLFENAKSNWLGFTAPAAGWIIATYHVDWHDWSYIVTGLLPEDDRA